MQFMYGFQRISVSFLSKQFRISLANHNENWLHRFGRNMIGFSKNRVFHQRLLPSLVYLRLWTKSLESVTHAVPCPLGGTGGWDPKTTERQKPWAQPNERSNRLIRSIFAYSSFTIDIGSSRDHHYLIMIMIASHYCILYLTIGHPDSDPECDRAHILSCADNAGPTTDPATL